MQNLLDFFFKKNRVLHIKITLKMRFTVCLDHAAPPLCTFASLYGCVSERRVPLNPEFVWR